MPIWNGQYIPFDEDVIAGLLYQGQNVFPDPDISPARREMEELLINEKLRGLWGGRRMRGVDSVDSFSLDPLFKTSPQDDNVIYNRGLQNHFFRRVIPNPFETPNIRIIDPNMPLNRPITIEGKARPSGLGSGLLGMGLQFNTRPLLGREVGLLDKG